MFNEGLNTKEILSKSIEEAKQFLSGEKSIPIDKIENDVLLQKSICKVMIEFWSNPKIQSPFIDLIVELPPDISFDMLFSIFEVINKKEIMSSDEKNAWVMKVAERVREIEEDIDPMQLNEYIKVLLGILNGLTVDDMLSESSYLNQEIFENSNEDDEDENDEDDDDDYIDEDEDEDGDNDDDEENEDDDDDDDFITNRNYSDSNNLDRRRINGESYNIPQVEKKREIFNNKDRPEMNPRILASDVLSGKVPNEATLNILKKNLSFAKAYANALALQSVISEMKGSYDIPYRFIVGVQYISDDIVYHAWNTLLQRRVEISATWEGEGKENWKSIINSSKYSEEKVRKIYEVLGWKYEIKAKPEKKKDIIEVTESNNKFVSKVKYYFENIGFEDPNLIKNLQDEDKLLYARAISSQFVKYFDDPESNAVELYSYAVYELDIDTFEKAIDYLVEHFELAGKTMNIEIKKDISSAIMRTLSSLSLEKDIFEEYQNRLINSITGYSKIEQK